MDTIRAEIGATYRNAKEQGFDTKALRHVVKMRRMEADARDAFENAIRRLQARARACSLILRLAKPPCARLSARPCARRSRTPTSPPPNRSACGGPHLAARARRHATPHGPHRWWNA